MLDKLKNSKMAARLLSVVFAVAIWLALTYTVNPTITQTVKNVSVTYTGENELVAHGLVADGKSRVQSVDVKIRGPRNSVIAAMGTVSAEVDLSDIASIGEKTRNVSIDVGTSGVALVGRVQPKVSVTVEELVDKQVPVKIIQTGIEKNRRKIAGSAAAEEYITLRGAKSELSQIAAATASVDISEVEGEITRQAALGFVNSDGAKLSPGTLIDAPERVEVTTRLYERKTVAVEVILPQGSEEDFALTVKSVSKDKIDVGMEDGAAEIYSISAVFDPVRWREGQEEYTIKLQTPEGIYIPEEYESITAKLAVEKLAERVVSFLVSVKNTASGLKAKCNVQNISLHVRGAASAFGSDTTAYVDAGGLGEGYYELPVTLDAASKLELCESAYVGVSITQ